MVYYRIKKPQTIKNLKSDVKKIKKTPKNKTEFWHNRMPCQKNVDSRNAAVPVCCQPQCLRRSSRTLWERRPLETGPCWTQWADRSSRRLRLRLWPAFSWSLPWLQTRSTLKSKGKSGLRPADTLSTGAKRAIAAPATLVTFSCDDKTPKTSQTTNEDEPLTFLFFSIKNFRQPSINGHI